MGLILAGLGAAVSLGMMLGFWARRDLFPHPKKRPGKKRGKR